MAQSYALFKELDPFHPTFGAVNCDDGHAFSDGQPGTEPTEVDRTVPVLPFNKQPALQLSLDVPMLENYGTTIASHVHDGERVKGLWQEPKVNCPPNYGFATAAYSAPSAPVPALPAAQYRSLLWLGVIKGGMMNQLAFDIGCPEPPCTLPILANTFYEFGAELQALRPSLYAPFGRVASPLAVELSNHSIAGLFGRVYAQSAWCLHLVVVNTDTSRPTAFTASFSAPVPPLATTLFTADYSIQLNPDGSLEDWIGPGQTNVYQIGANCTVPSSFRVRHKSDEEPSCTASRLLANGICLPATFPPRAHRNLTEMQHNGFPPPPYLVKPPSVIDISLGRQLFVDSFLIDPIGTRGVRTTFHQAQMSDKPVLVSDNGTAAKTWNDARMRSIWWDPAAKVFKAWSSCGAPGYSGLCFATSADGATFTKPRAVSIPQPPGVSRSDGASVILDYDDPDPSQRFKMAEKPYCGSSDINFSAFCRDPDGGRVAHDHQLGRSAVGAENLGWRLLASPDGIGNWRVVVNKTGLTGDAGTIFRNPFRDRWVFSIKAVSSQSSPTPENGHLGSLDRWRMYQDTGPELFDPLSQDRWAPDEPLPWLCADVLDPPWMGESRLHLAGAYPGLYVFDAAAYESLLVGFYTIFRCKGLALTHGAQRCPPSLGGNNDSLHGEFSAVFVGFSRNGFDFSRPPPGEPWPAAGVALSREHRVPLFPQSPQQDSGSWNWGTVRAISSGGLTISEHGDQLRFFVTGSSAHTGPLLATTGTAVIRRDGFASIDATTAAAGTAPTLLTRPLLFNNTGGFAFANIIGEVQWSVLDAASLAPILPFLAANSRCGCCNSGRANSTKCPFVWVAAAQGADRGVTRLSALAGRVVRFRFDLAPGSSLYSFWVSQWKTGESAGFVGSGGPGLPGSRDLPVGCSL